MEKTLQHERPSNLVGTASTVETSPFGWRGMQQSRHAMGKAVRVFWRVRRHPSTEFVGDAEAEDTLQRLRGQGPEVPVVARVGAGHQPPAHGEPSASRARRSGRSGGHLRTRCRFLWRRPNLCWNGLRNVGLAGRTRSLGQQDFWADCMSSKQVEWQDASGTHLPAWSSAITWPRSGHERWRSGVRDLGGLALTT